MSVRQPAAALNECEPAELSGRIGPARATPGYVVFVGMGLGGPLQLTLAGLKTISEAEVIVLDPEIDEAILDEPEVSSRDGAAILTAGIDPDLTKVAALATGGNTVAWLLSGDPLVDGVAGPLANRLAELGCRIDMVPGLSRAALATTTAGIDLGVGARLLGAEPDAQAPLVALINSDQMEHLAERASEFGLGPDSPALVTVGYATSAQQSVSTTIAGLRKLDVSGPVSVVLGEAAQRERRLNWYESKPLFGWHVLVPRTKGLSGVLERRLEHHGAMPVQVPTISVEPPRNPQPIERAIQGLVDGRYQWIIFNSANAVRAVTERLEQLGLDSRAFSGLRIAAVGVPTVDALRNWGISPDLVPLGEQRSEELAAEFPVFDDVLDPINRILIPRAEIAVDALVQGLHELGWEVEDVVAYRTVRAAPPPAEIREGIKAGRFDAVVFTSASTVRNMVGIAGKPHTETIVAAIGPATVASCQEHGLRVDVVANWPGPAELADALAEFAAQRRAQLIADGETPRRPSERRGRRRR